MDQNSANSDKRNWRERLGIGTRDMPKLSDEFKTPAPVQTASPRPQGQPAQRPAVKAAQPVTRPAPMAPRVVAAKPAPSSASNGQPKPAMNHTQLAQSPTQEALADKLRAQRAAAEKLAEQRVQAARERAEGRPAAEPSLGLSRSKPEPSLTPPPGPRPKFTFADEDAGRREAAGAAEAPAPISQRPAAASGPLLPPRPALGGERSQPPFLRQAAPLGQQATRPEPPVGYRPIDPATGYPLPPPRPSAPVGRPPYGNEPSAYPGRLPPRPPAYDPYARGQEPPYTPADPYGDDPRTDPRLSRPPLPRSRPRAYEPEEEEVFEEELPPRRRASARDYQSAYRENDEGFEEDRRRSNGPLLLLGALLAAALAVAVGVWYYNTKIKAGPAATSQTQTDSVPVIAAPEQAAKTAPEQPADAQGTAPAAVKKKQIYDRIVGEQEVTGDQVVPTEEVPVQPEPAQTQVPAAGQIPQPAGSTATDGLPATDEPAPLPLPPPPGNDTQGSLDQTGIEKMATAASEEPPALPPPEPSTAGAAESVQASPPSTEEPAVIEEPVAKPAKPKAAKTAAVAKKKKLVAEEPAPGEASAETEALGTEPVVLVPPSQAASPTQGVDAAIPDQEATAPAPVKKKKTIFDLFKGTSAENAQPDQQVASIDPPEASAPAEPVQPAPQAKQASKPAAPTGSGYYVQLASFRTQGEAKAEYARLQSQHASIIGGVPSTISQATVAGSTRYRVGLGPVASREDAAKLCNSLFAAGERDCLVRSQ